MSEQTTSADEIRKLNIKAMDLLADHNIDEQTLQQCTINLVHDLFPGVPVFDDKINNQLHQPSRYDVLDDGSVRSIHTAIQLDSQTDLILTRVLPS